MTKHLLLGIVLWGISLVAGFAALTIHQMQPGDPGRPPKRGGPSPRMRLLLFAHPHCPCTRATVEELDRLMTSCRDRLDVVVYILRPVSKLAEWAKTPLYSRASRIDGVTVKFDDDGVSAQRYGALTSGQVLLYSARGLLLFSGGITASRGHEGDNAGRDAITELVLTGKTKLSATPVYGCALTSITKP